MLGISPLGWIHTLGSLPALPLALSMLWHHRRIDPRSTAEIFRRSGLDATHRIFDFASSPLAGLFPSWRLGYRVSRWLDDGIIHLPGIKNLGSNFEVIAKKL